MRVKAVEVRGRFSGGHWGFMTPPQELEKKLGGGGVHAQYSLHIVDAGNTHTVLEALRDSCRFTSRTVAVQPRA